MTFKNVKIRAMPDKFSHILDDKNVLKKKTDLEILGLPNNYFATNNLDAFKTHVKAVLLDTHPDKNNGSGRASEAFNAVRVSVDRIKKNIDLNGGTYVSPKPENAAKPRNHSGPASMPGFSNGSNFGSSPGNFSWWGDFFNDIQTNQRIWEAEIKKWEEELAKMEERFRPNQRPQNTHKAAEEPAKPKEKPDPYTKYAEERATQYRKDAEDRAAKRKETADQYRKEVKERTAQNRKDAEERAAQRKETAAQYRKEAEERTAQYRKDAEERAAQRKETAAQYRKEAAERTAQYRKNAAEEWAKPKDAGAQYRQEAEERKAHYRKKAEEEIAKQDQYKKEAEEQTTQYRKEAEAELAKYRETAVQYRKESEEQTAKYRGEAEAELSQYKETAVPYRKEAEEQTASNRNKIEIEKQAPRQEQESDMQKRRQFIDQILAEKPDSTHFFQKNHPSTESILKGIHNYANKGDIMPLLSAMDATNQKNNNFHLPPQTCRICIKVIDFYFSNVASSMNAQPLRETRTNATKELQGRLSTLKEYGQRKNNATVLKLCSDLEMDLTKFINFTQPLKEFKSLFLTRLHSQDDVLQGTKAWVYIVNIAIACITLGVAHLIKFAHSKYTGKNSFLFFGQSEAQEKICHLETELHSSTPV